MDCPGCTESLRRSLYRDDGLKSCPACSVRAGRHAFHRLGYFGMRHLAAAVEPIMQSWCRDCRADRIGQMPEAYCASAISAFESVTTVRAKAADRKLA